jgi:6-phosphogluconolactonase (cycloisomerase 2 family)
MLLHNSHDVSIYCDGREDGRRGYASCAIDFDERNRKVYVAGYKAGRVVRIRRMSAAADQIDSLKLVARAS